MLQRYVGIALVGLFLSVVPNRARAEFTLAGSAGFGFQVDPTARVGGVNLMITPGFQFLELLRIELGILGAIENSTTQGTDLGLEFRPMLVLAPPAIPLYGRIIVSSVDPFSSERRAWAYGLGAGLGFDVGGAEIFAEIAALPRYIGGTMRWLLEARGGLLFRL